MRVAWLRVDTQTILTIQTHVITKNHRMTITHVEGRKWVLRIKDVKESDKGWYMCQVNTDPMRNQIGFLNVVVPPNILDYPTSTDMPVIMWRREGNEPISTGASSLNASTFTISRVNRLHMGAYLCIASNGIPPSVSKRVMLIVHFPPMIWIQDQLVGAALGQRLTLECNSEAFPRSINYWMKNDTIITQGKRFEPSTHEASNYKVVMKLTIKEVDIGDFGTYKCVVKNSLGETGRINQSVSHSVDHHNSHYSSNNNHVANHNGNSVPGELRNMDLSKDKDRDRYRENSANLEDQREKEAFVDNDTKSDASVGRHFTARMDLTVLLALLMIHFLR
ncbi:hypothetical protein quinque_008952 [Culex quinquefasciatus]